MNEGTAVVVVVVVVVVDGGDDDNDDGGGPSLKFEREESGRGIEKSVLIR